VPDLLHIKQLRILMINLFLEACGLLLTILVGTRGFATIPDGYEDELGFHYETDAARRVV
jgi:hypothetical protein